MPLFRADDFCTTEKLRTSSTKIRCQNTKVVCHMTQQFYLTQPQIMIATTMAALANTCEPWCSAPCAELNGDVRWECGACPPHHTCRPGAVGWPSDQGAVDVGVDTSGRAYAMGQRQGSIESDSDRTGETDEYLQRLSEWRQADRRDPGLQQVQCTLSDERLPQPEVGASCDRIEHTALTRSKLLAQRAPLIVSGLTKGWPAHDRWEEGALRRLYGTHAWSLTPTENRTINELLDSPRYNLAHAEHDVCHPGSILRPLGHAMPRLASPRLATPRHATPRHATPRHAVFALSAPPTDRPICDAPPQGCYHPQFGAYSPFLLASIQDDYEQPALLRPPSILQMSLGCAWLALSVPRPLRCPLIVCSLLAGPLLTQNSMDRGSPPQRCPLRTSTRARVAAAADWVYHPRRTRQRGLHRSKGPSAGRSTRQPYSGRAQCR
jgi:hypothetical protein